MPQTDDPQVETTESVDSPEIEETTNPKTLDEIKAENERLRKALKVANDESAKRRKKLDAYEAAENTRKQAEMSELEKANAELADLKRQHEAAQAELQTRRILDLSRKAATEINITFHEDALADALKLGYLTVEFNDQDKPIGLKESLRELAKERPYLVKQSTGATSSEIDATKRGKTDKVIDKEAKKLEYARRFGI